MARDKKTAPAAAAQGVKEFNVRQLQQLRFEIEGKMVTNKTTGEQKQEMDGILRAKNFSQREKIELRKKSKEIETLLETIGKQEEALFNEFYEGFGTPNPKIKDESKEAKEEFEKNVQNLFTSLHKIAKVEGITVEQIEAVTDTADFYQFLHELQS